MKNPSSAKKASPKARSSSPKTDTPAKQSPKSKSSSTKAASPGMTSPKARSPSSKAVTPGKQSPKSRSPSPKAVTPAKKSPKSKSLSPAKGKSPSISKVGTPACQTPTVQGRFSVSRVSTPSPLEGTASTNEGPLDTETHKLAPMRKSTARKSQGVGKSAVKAKCRRSSISRASMKSTLNPEIYKSFTFLDIEYVLTPYHLFLIYFSAFFPAIISWADRVKFGRAKSQVAVPAKMIVTKGIVKKSVPKPKVSIVTVPVLYETFIPFYKSYNNLKGIVYSFSSLHYVDIGSGDIFLIQITKVARRGKGFPSMYNMYNIQPFTPVALINELKDYSIHLQMSLKCVFCFFTDTCKKT